MRPARNAARLLAQVVAVLVAFAAQAGAQEIPRPKATPKDVYVSCYLLVRDKAVNPDLGGVDPPYQSTTCAAFALLSIATREGAPATVRYRFCLPDDAYTSAEPAKAMAYAYIDWFEKLGFAVKDDNGAAAFVFAMIDRWPCRD